MYCIGVDPDLHNIGLALLNGDGTVLDVRIISSSGKKEEAAVIAMARQLRVEWFPGYAYHNTELTIVVEAQELYLGGGTKNPRNIMHLAQVAGAAICVASYMAIGPNKTLYFPRPQEWKGQVPKRIHQARILKQLGWPHVQVGTNNRGYSYPITGEQQLCPCARPPLQKTQWTHAVDAIGLALWGLEKAKQRRHITSM